MPGVVAMAATGSEVIYQGAFGKRDLGKPDAMTLDTVFWIASMTKAITSAAAMQLVEQGKLSLDGPIGKILPEIADMQVLRGLRRERQAEAAPRQAADHPQALAHAHGRLLLQHLERRHGQVHGACRNSRRDHVREQGADLAALVRSG